MTETANQLPKNEWIKEIATGFLGIILGIWTIVALFALIGLNMDIDDAGNKIIGWQWYHWIVLGPLWAAIVGFVTLCAWALGSNIRGNI